MKNLVVLISILFMTLANAQDNQPKPQISVAGEGKVKVVPDQAQIVVAVETRGSDAKDVKKKNDAAVEKVIQFIRKFNLPKADVQTQRVVLEPNYDYNKKVYTNRALQSIEIMLRDLNQYDALMQGLTEAGITTISKVEFQSSNQEIHEAEARKLAMKDALKKAADYASVLNGQKVGKAIQINDNTQNYYPRVMYAAMKSEMADASEPRETLAIGEINIQSNVSVSFLLE